MPEDRVAKQMRETDPTPLTILLTGWAIPTEDSRLSDFDLSLQKPIVRRRAFLSVIDHALHLKEVRKGSPLACLPTTQGIHSVVPSRQRASRRDSHLLQLDYSYQNIINGQGFSIAITGMLIVFSALTLISVFVTALPKLLTSINRIWPESTPVTEARPSGALSGASDPTVVAAIGYALHQQRKPLDR